MAVIIVELADLSNMSWGPVPVVFATVALDASYPTGGYGTSLGMNAAAFSLRGITGIWPLGANSAAAGYFVQWNTQTAKLMAFAGAGFTPAGTISAPTITTLTNAGTTAPVYVNGGALTETTGATGITGVQAPTFTGTAVAAGVVQVSNTTNLSTLTFTVVVFGIR